MYYLRGGVRAAAAVKLCAYTNSSQSDWWPNHQHLLTLDTCNNNNKNTLHRQFEGILILIGTPSHHQVYFPDIERCEWLNRILKQVWPNANHFAKSLLKYTIEPNVQKALANYKLNNFKFDRMVLGTIVSVSGLLRIGIIFSRFKYNGCSLFIL